MLVADKSNKHRVSSLVKSTVAIPNQIPFLRDARDVSNQNFAYLDALASENTGNFKMLNAKTKKYQTLAR